MTLILLLAFQLLAATYYYYLSLSPGSDSLPLPLFDVQSEAELHRGGLSQYFIALLSPPPSRSLVRSPQRRQRRSSNQPLALLLLAVPRLQRDNPGSDVQAIRAIYAHVQLKVRLVRQLERHDNSKPRERAAEPAKQPAGTAAGEPLHLCELMLQVEEKLKWHTHLVLEVVGAGG